MKIRCDVIKDLLPLYAEDLASEGSRELVETHMEECDGCKKELDKIRKPEIEVSFDDRNHMKRFATKLRKHTINIILFTVFITAAVMSLISGLLLKPGDEMGYTIFYFYLLLPFTSFVCTLLLGLRATKLKYLAPILFGGLGLIIPTIIYHYFDTFALNFSFYPSLFGLIIGHIIYLIRKKR